MSEKILVVEDEITLQETLTYNLIKLGYDVKVVGDGNLALKTARQFHPDLIVMDIMLPGIDGLEITRILRQELATPVLMLTARADEIDQVVGLEVGADDYMTKPFSMREFLARVKAILRRVRMLREEFSHEKEELREEQLLLKYGNLIINQNRREVKLSDKVVPMKPKEYELLLFMAQHDGQVLTREFILERVWGWDYIGDSRTVDVHVRWLRSKIEDNPDEPIRIVTVRGAGYRFEG
jgi:DNA-binding response OmpR family regulator